MQVVYECLNDSSHVFNDRNGTLEGVSCPVCDNQVLPVRLDEDKDNSIPDYITLKKKYRKNIIRCECLLFNLWKAEE